MSLSSEGYFPRKNWFDALPGSKTQHKDIIESDEDILNPLENGDISLYFGSNEAADKVLAMYAESFGISDANAPSAEDAGELAMPASEALRRFEAEVGASAVAETVDYPGQEAA